MRCPISARGNPHKQTVGNPLPKPPQRLERDRLPQMYSPLGHEPAPVALPDVLHREDQGFSDGKMNRRGRRPGCRFIGAPDELRITRKRE